MKLSFGRPVQIEFRGAARHVVRIHAFLQSSATKPFKGLYQVERYVYEWTDPPEKRIPASEVKVKSLINEPTDGKDAGPCRAFGGGKRTNLVEDSGARVFNLGVEH